ncbi:MAG: outer membrane lipoprotein carrier protein LolA [Bdellovibrionales bacterium]|nr:outer membrane lipoprotein carrier protein LolA [Bdellovibrionales bacterium]
MRLLSLLLAAILGVYGGVEDGADPADSFVCQSDLPPADYKALIDSIEGRYGSVADVRAHFIQYSYFAGLDKGEKSYGDVSFRKPGMMDWHYKGPEVQRFISNGTTMWFHQPEDNQVTVAAFTNSFQSDLPVSFLLGLGKISKSFKVERACKAAAGTVVELSPLEQSGDLQRFRLLVRPDDYVPIGAQVLDIGGNETSIRLAGLSLNSGIKETEFEFSIPKGVDVIDRRSGAESGGEINEKSLLPELN